MSGLPPFRDRTAAQFREQADGFRDIANLASPPERQQLLRLAARYDELSRLKEAEEPPG